VKERISEIRRLLEECTVDERRAILEHLREQFRHPLEVQWGVAADTILSAIKRSSDLTQRGVRGVIAEAIFEQSVLPSLSADWTVEPIEGDQSYDFLLARGSQRIRVQVKLQRLKAGRPMLASEGSILLPSDMYTVEVQRTRGGTDPSTNSDTRPYRFGEFDLLAVNMHPSTGNWKRFMFTVANWLIPREEDPNLIMKFQPVSPYATDCWTDRLDECIDWYQSGMVKRIFLLPTSRPGARRTRRAAPTD
jgi:hypothetical protein